MLGLTLSRATPRLYRIDPFAKRSANDRSLRILTIASRWLKVPSPPEGEVAGSKNVGSLTTQRRHFGASAFG
jgi:hypothetical protein